jgi:HEAT repeat protein
MGHVVAVEGLTKLIEEAAFMGRPKYPDAVRVNALFALARIGGDAARSVVEKAVDDKSRSVQIAAQSALRRMKTDEQAGNG